jgi:hypothetical protein
VARSWWRPLAMAGIGWPQATGSGRPGSGL